MNYLFWNVCGRKIQKINDYLVDVVIDKDLNLISLAEYEDDKNDLLKKMMERGYDFYHIPNIGCKRIEIFSTIKPGQVEHLRDTDYYTIKRIPHPSLGKIIFAFVHFPSKQYANDRDLLVESIKFKNVIEDVEKECNSSVTVITGDFNMNPFEEGMMAAAGIHAFPTKFEANKKQRTIKGTKYSMFYNPMWSFFGDTGTPVGTYYYSASHQYNLYWNIFDQVLVRPSLIEKISNVNILTKINETDLIDKKDKPNISDHLPLLFNIKE